MRPLPPRTSTLIIGGGPSGLVALKYALETTTWPPGAEPVLLEAERDVGGTFRYRGYENAELVSSKQLTCFSDFRYPISAPDHPTLPNFVSYLHAYTTEFRLWPNVHLGVQVVRLEKSGSGAYPHVATVRNAHPESLGDVTEGPITIAAQRVIIATGLHVVPNIPPIPGLNKAPLSEPHVEWIHSSEYKKRDQLADRDVLVLGAGETGMDVAYEAAHVAKTVSLGVRTGFLSFPKVLNNFRILGSTFDGALPIDGLITNLFEDAYVHPWVAASHLRWFVSDFVIRRVMWVMTGTMAGCNQWAGELEPERQGRAYVFLNKSGKAMQFINRPFHNLSRLHRLFFSYMDPPAPPNDPTIHLVPFPSRFENGAAVFPPPPPHRAKETAWKQPCRPDLVVLATGYRQDFDFLGKEYARPHECDVRGVCDSRDTSVGYIGFLRPGVGAIPPMAEMQTQLFFLLSQGRMPLPTSEENYHLLHRTDGRIQYGVDYSTYMAQLARDMGTAPSLLELWREYGTFVTFVYCFGAAFPTFYRLLGPYRTPKAETVVRTELWETIRRRGVVGNLFMGAFYAVVNALVLIVDVGWTLLGHAVPAVGGPPHSVFQARRRTAKPDFAAAAPPHDGQN